MTIGVWANVLQLVASILQFIGGLMMANSFLTPFPFWQWPALLKSIFIKKAAITVAMIVDAFGGEQKAHSVRGLSLIILGFFIQLVGTILNLIE
jgi:hypothetical protein